MSCPSPNAPTPPGPGEVVIDQAASRVNVADVAKRAGRIPQPLPFIPAMRALPGQAGGADRRGVVDLADAGDLAVADGEVLGDAQRPDGPGVQVIQEHRL